METENIALYQLCIKTDSHSTRSGALVGWSGRPERFLGGKNTMTKIIGFAICCLLLAGAMQQDDAPRIAQVVALDECDPATFNAPTAVGADFCRNVALGASTTFS